MSMLKNKNLKGCNSLLREFIDAVSIDEGNDELKTKKEKAILALHHLEKITGGMADHNETYAPCGPRNKIPG
ncbi:hypothetical protein ACFLQP_02880 [Acidobacteriota bacterium]